MPYKLKKLKIDRVDLVDRGANQEAHVVLFKRDAGIEKAKTLQEILDQQERREEAYEEKWKITDAFMESLSSCCELSDGDEKQRIVMESAKQYVEMMQPVYDALKPQNEDVEMSEELQKQLDALQAENAELVAKNAELVAKVEASEAEIAKRDSEPEEVDIWKGVHPEIRKKFEAQEQEIAVAKAAAQAEHDSRVKQECIAKTRMYSHLPMNPDDDWEVLKAIDTLDAKVSKRVYELFNAGNTNLTKAGLTEERGTQSDSGAGGRTAIDEINKLANEKITKSEGGLKYDDALSAVFHERPDLYREYTKSVKSGERG